jgi:C-terminal processing protease CtpA/Prc
MLTGVHVGRLAVDVSGMGFVARQRMARLAGVLEIGDVEFVEPIVDDMPEGTYLIGTEILKNFSLTFDPVRHNVECLPYRRGRVITPSIHRYGIRLDRSTSPWTVIDVDDGAPIATKQKIRQGDLCLRANGESLKGWTSLLNDEPGTNAVHLTLSREGKEFEVTVDPFLVLQ